MCEGLGVSNPAEALAALDDALGYLASFDVAAAPMAVQARVLRALEQAESRQTAARSRALVAFAADGGPEADGQQSARAWLTWQTRVTPAVAAGAVAWARRLAAHPVVERSLAAGDVSTSWARQICEWSERLPKDRRQDADEVLVEAANGGAGLRDLAGLAQEMYERSRQDRPDAGMDEGFDDRYFRLGITFGGAGRAEGDLTPECTAALSAVLAALSKKAGPEDTRTAAQRRHDALGEACRRLIAAGLLPGRAGQPTQIQVHLSLAQLRALPGAAEVEAAWLAASAGPGWLSGPAADAAACDATVVPVVTGHVDWAALDRLVDAFLAAHRPLVNVAGSEGDGEGGAGLAGSDSGEGGAGLAGSEGDGEARPVGAAAAGGADRSPLPEATRQRLRGALLALAVEALSGPGGLAATLRANLGGAPLASVSLPLDVGAATETIPAHLRRAVVARHPRCGFPGCDIPASQCDIHHLIPRSEGGPTALHALLPLCGFHHLVVIHRWGWTLRLNPDGTTTATSPDGRVINSHDPPPGRAA